MDSRDENFNRIDMEIIAVARINPIIETYRNENSQSIVAPIVDRAKQGF